MPDPTDRPAFDDPVGFARFYECFADRLRRYLVVVGASVVDAEDCAHDTLLAVWTRRARIKGWPDHCDSYIFSAARRKLVDTWRKAQPCVLTVDELADVPACTESPEAAAERSEARGALGQGLGALSPRDRALLIDAEVHGLPGYVLAARHGFPNDNVLRQNRWRARKRLARHVPDLAPGLAAWPVAAYRRVGNSLRSGWRFGANAVTSLATQPQPLTVMLSAITIIAAPYNGPWRFASSASAREPGLTINAETWRPPAVVVGPVLPAAGLGSRRAWWPTPVGDRPTSALAALRSPLSPEPPTVVPDPPSVCLGGKCATGTPGNQDVLTVHGPAPVNDRSVATDVAPICRIAPDTPWTSCHTEGNPDYRVPPPPPNPT